MFGRAPAYPFAYIVVQRLLQGPSADPRSRHPEKCSALANRKPSQLSRIVGGLDELNQALEKADRVSEFLEIAELMCIDALDRTESCGGHFRVESQTPEGEAKRDDATFSYTAAWEWKGSGQAPALHKEPLAFEYVPLSQRSYK